ncbi:unnamed protein product [Caenorhabditis sp. 36 PRJEB53466]|nr:unnamed protein product [Caenorhabditis sp. 36 PRJEB53466]
MSALSLESVETIIGSDLRTDVSTRLCERIAFLIYQDSSFGLVPIESSSSKILSNINRLCKTSLRSGFPLDGETFVGRSEDPNILNHTRERILSATLMSTPKEDLPLALASFAPDYPSTATLAQKLLNNDERFLTNLLILLPLIETLPADSVFHPVSVFLEAMGLIGYDCEVLIDWLNSELAASSLLLRVLKSACNDKTKGFWRNYAPRKVDQSATVTKWKEELVSSGSPSVSLEIIEIVGDQEMAKTLELKGNVIRKVKCSEPVSLQNSGSFSRWIDTVTELKGRLRRLLAAKLVAKKFDVLLKWCDTFCALFVKK